MGLLITKSLFPLNRPRGLRRQIIQHPVHPGHLPGDPLGDPPQHRPGHLLDGGRHSVHRVHRPENHRPVKGPGAIPHPYRLKVRHHREILPYLPGKAGGGKLFPEDGVGFPQGLDRKSNV